MVPQGSVSPGIQSRGGNRAVPVPRLFCGFFFFLLSMAADPSSSSSDPPPPKKSRSGHKNNDNEQAPTWKCDTRFIKCFFTLVPTPGKPKDFFALCFDRRCNTGKEQGEACKISDGSPTALRKHLVTVHEIFDAEALVRRMANSVMAPNEQAADQSQPRIDQLLQRHRSDAKREANEVFAKQLVLWIIDGNLPFSVVNNSRFRALVKYISGGLYGVPDRTTLSRTYLPKVYDEVRTEVKDILSKVKYAAPDFDFSKNKHTGYSYGTSSSHSELRIH